MLIRDIIEDDVDGYDEFNYLIDPETNKEIDLNNLQTGKVYDVIYDINKISYLHLLKADDVVYGLVIDSHKEYIMTVTNPKNKETTVHKIKSNPLLLTEEYDEFPVLNPGDILRFYRPWDVDQEEPLSYIDLREDEHEPDGLLFDKEGKFIVIPESVGTNKPLFANEYMMSLTVTESNKILENIENEFSYDHDDYRREEDEGYSEDIEDMDDDDDYEDDDDEEYSIFNANKSIKIIGYTDFKEGFGDILNL